VDRRNGARVEVDRDRRREAGEVRRVEVRELLAEEHERRREAERQKERQEREDAESETLHHLL
jgi:hypothetical protein